MILLKSLSALVAAMLQEKVGFFDESGTQAGAKVLTLGGWVASITEWDDFNKFWDDALHKHDVTIFRFANCDNGRGQFQGWSVSRKIGLIEDLIRVICRHDIHGFCGAITMRDYKGVVDGAGSVLEEKHSPYIMCQPYLIEQICQKIDKSVFYIFEEQREFRAFAAQNFWDIKEKFPDRTPKMDGLAYRPTSEWPRLQAADLLVYETAKSLANEGRHDLTIELWVDVCFEGHPLKPSLSTQLAVNDWLSRRQAQGAATLPVKSPNRTCGG